MKIAFYILLGIFILLGVGTLNTASQFKYKHLGLTLGGVAYLGAAFAAYNFDNWWFFIIGFSLALMLRFIFGDSSSRSYVKEIDVNKLVEKEMIKQVEKETPTSTFRNRDSMEQLCKDLGVPFSKNTQKSGTASIRFTRKTKEEQKEE